MDQELRRIQLEVAATLEFLERSRLNELLLQLRARLETVSDAQQAYAAARGCSLPDLAQVEDASETDVAIGRYLPLGIGAPLAKLLALQKELREFLHDVGMSQAA